MNECEGMTFTMSFDQVVRVGDNPEAIKKLQQEIDELGKRIDENTDKLSGIEDGAEVNDITVIKADGVEIKPVDKVVDIPIKEAVGIPELGETVENGVGYDNDENIVVKSLDVSKLVQNGIEELVLNGGSAV